MPTPLFRAIPLVTACLIIFVIVLIPVAILSHGYMPRDDALRHAAKVISGKEWNQVLVIRDDVRMDGHPGWHAVLAAVRKAMDFDAHSLVLFSVFILFILFSLVPTLVLKRPEAWVLTLLVVCIADTHVLGRLLLGRPFMVTMASMAAICLLWEGLNDDGARRRTVAALTAVVAIATYVHGGWYLFALPVAALFIARQWRAGALMALAAVVGIGAGAAFTGHPIPFLTQTLRHVLLSFSSHKTTGVLVTEFQPFSGDIPVVTVAILMLVWRSLRGGWRRRAVDNPVAILALVSWALGFVTTRVWLDVGLAAAMVWIAEEFQDVLIRYIPELSWKRLLAAGAVSAVLFAATTNDAYNRWSQNRPTNYVKFDTPEKAAWAPGHGGTVYNTDMLVFYSMFYYNPTADWRYVLGFEPAIMRPDDLATYRKMQVDFQSSSFTPWVAKMRPEDRFVIFDMTTTGPKIPGLEWHDAGNFVWIGRLPVKGPKS